MNHRLGAPAGRSWRARVRDTWITAVTSPHATVAALAISMLVSAASLAAVFGAFDGTVRAPTSATVVPGPHDRHRIVFHVPSDDAAGMSHAISSADNAMKFYRARGQSAEIEIVANGAGVRMMRADTSPVAPSIAYLHKTYPSIVLSACGTTLSLMKAREGIEPPLLDGVSVTPAGIARIVELEEAGWSYVRS